MIYLNLIDKKKVLDQVGDNIMTEEEQNLITKAREAYAAQEQTWERKRVAHQEDLKAKKEKAFEELKNKFPTLKATGKSLRGKYTEPYFNSEMSYDYEIFELLGYDFALHYGPISVGSSVYAYYLRAWNPELSMYSPYCNYEVRDLTGLGGFLASMERYESDRKK
jgi:hypothetical protein